MEDFKKQHRDLEQRVLRELRNKVENSTQTSKHSDAKAIMVNMFDYAELAIVHDRLIFVDNRGYEYSLFADCSLEDLIDILKTEI